MNRFFILPVLCGLVASAQVDVLTANYDNNRTNANLAESILTPRTVGPSTFGKLASFTVSGQIFAQPLVATQVSIPACGVCDVVFVATMEDRVYAFNATTFDPTPLWMVTLGTPVSADGLGLKGSIRPFVGILSTPVISRGRGAIYVATHRLRHGQPSYQLHALDLTTGQEILNGPVDITATAQGSGDASVDGAIALDPTQHIMRPALLAANGAIYLGFGSIFDRGPYHGWVLAYNMDDLQQQVAVFNSTPDGALGGIWQSGRGFVADDAGNIYLGTGNGDYDGLTNFGESFLRLSPGLQVVDWFTPADWENLSNVDLDTGSLGPVLIPSIDMLFGGDKASNGYLIDRNNMSHLGLTSAAVPQIVQPIGYGGLFNIAVWDRADGPLVYCIDEGTATLAWRITDRQFESQPFSQTTVTSDYPWQGIAISAWGDLDGTGILWMTAGDHSQSTVPGTLYAFNAQDLTKLLWTSEMNPIHDRLGQFAKFTAPTVANGLVFVPTFSNHLVVYGLISPSTPVTSTSSRR
jgi:hypothetical protein